MADIVEIDALMIADKYGDIEPLLALLESHGLHDPKARKIVADAARGKSPRKANRPPSQENILRNERIRIVVANRRGLLNREGKSERGAIGKALPALQEHYGLTREQIARIVKEPSIAPATIRVAFAYGQQGVEIRP